MHTQTGTRSRQQRTQTPRPEARALRLLKTPPKNHPLFWLVFALRDGESLSQIEALDRAEWAKKRKQPLLLRALNDAAGALRKEWSQSVRYAADDGLLLMCWNGTRALDEVAA